MLAASILATIIIAVIDSHKSIAQSVTSIIHLGSYHMLQSKNYICIVKWHRKDEELTWFHVVSFLRIFYIPFHFIYYILELAGLFQSQILCSNSTIFKSFTSYNTTDRSPFLIIMRIRRKKIFASSSDFFYFFNLILILSLLFQLFYMIFSMCYVVCWENAHERSVLSEWPLCYGIPPEEANKNNMQWEYSRASAQKEHQVNRKKKIN